MCPANTLTGKLSFSELVIFDSVSLLVSDPSPCPGRGQARLARAGEGSSHVYHGLSTCVQNEGAGLLKPVFNSLLAKEKSTPQSSV